MLVMTEGYEGLDHLQKLIAWNSAELIRLGCPLRSNLQYATRPDSSIKHLGIKISHILIELPVVSFDL